MKKILIITIIGLISFNLQAQFGVRGGVDLAKVKGEVSDSYESESDSESYTGYYVGIFNNMHLGENFSLRPELNYFHFSKEEQSNLVDHIQMPILLNINFADTVNFMVGPSVSYLFNTSEGVKSFNYSGNIGLAINFNGFQIEGRYVKGFANLYDGDDYGYDIDLNIDSIQIGLTFSVD